MREIKFSLIFITFSMIFFLNLTEIDDPDFFWHIKTGEKIVKEGFIKKDPFSWSFPQKKWVNHEWLSQVLFFEVKKNFGFFSLVLLKAILNTFTFFLVFLLAKQKSSFESSIFTTALAGCISSITFSVRPQIFSYFFFALLMLFIERKKWLYLPPLFALWVNFHGAFIVGLGLLFIFAIYHFTKEQDSKLLKIFIVSALFTFLNPNGIYGFLHPFSYIFTSTKIHLNYIMEWMGPDFHSSYGLLFIFYVLISIFVFSKSRFLFFDFLLYSIFFSVTLFAVRNITFFMILTAPIISKHLNLSSEKTKFSRNSGLNFVINVLILISASVFLTGLLIKNFSDGALSEKYPWKAISVIKQKNLKRILAPYHWGGFLIYNDIPVFIDGRADFYPGKFLEEFFQSTELEKDPEKLLNKYKIKNILWEKNTPLYFYLKEKWTLIYSDKICAIFSYPSGR